MRELVSRVEGGCMSACFHIARAAESYRMAVSLGQAKVQISMQFDWLGGNFAGFWKDLTGVGLVF